MLSISSIAVDSIPSTSSATLATGILNSNIEDLLPSPVKRIPEKPIRKGRTWQHAEIMTSAPVNDSVLMKKKIRKHLEQQKKETLCRKLARSRNL
ncbi:hypothetical protein JTB14_011146 [Gonioctena quinquepunctata]|nr:hypothetical protein JTB14_011146 [Gonioctena quinquepunctata]